MNFKKLAISAALMLLAPVAALAYDTNYKPDCDQERFSSTPAEEADTNKLNAEIVFYGDSRMESTCTAQNGRTKTYRVTVPQAVALNFGFVNNNRIKERSRDATSTADLNYTRIVPPDFDWNTSNYLEPLDKIQKAKVVVLAFGTNDVWYDMTGPHPNPVPFKARLKTMAQVALNTPYAGGGKRFVALVEPYKACWYGSSYFPGLPGDDKEAERIAQIDKALRPYVNDINAVANELNADSNYAGRVAVVPLYDNTNLALNCTKAGVDTSDGLHATQNAILRIGTEVWGTLRQFPLVTSAITKTQFSMEDAPPVFSWDAKNVSNVAVQCTGAVSAAYSGSSLKDGIAVEPVSSGTGTCTVTATNSAGLTAAETQTVTVTAPPLPTVTTSVTNTTLTMGENYATIFSWDASHANSVLVQCTGSVGGAYSGTSLQNGIYVVPQYPGAGSCTATAYNGNNQQASSTKAVTVQPDLPTITVSVGTSTLTLAGGPTVFSWNATRATSVSVRCTGSVNGVYEGSSLQNGIYAIPASVGPGSCSATATNAGGQTATASVALTVQ